MKKTNESFVYILPNDIAKRILALSGNSQQAVYIVLLSGAAFVTAMYAGSNEVVIGSPAVKQKASGGNAIYLISVSIRGSLTYREYLLGIKQLVSEAYKKESKIEKNVDMDALDKQEVKSIVLLDGLNNADTACMKAGMVFHFNIIGEGIKCIFEFDEALYERESIICITKWLEAFFNAALEAFDSKLSDIEILLKKDNEGLAGDITVAVRDLSDSNTKLVEEESNIPILLRKGKDIDKNLFFIHDGSGEIDSYVELTSRLGLGLNCWGIRADRLEYCFPANITIEETAAKYVKRIKAINPNGPYLISGWSIGGTIAFEIAAILEKHGDEVSFLGLIDSPAPQEFHVSEARKFGVESEKEMLISFLHNSDIKEKISGLSDMKEVYKTYIDYIDNRTDILEATKKLIHEELLEMVPEYARNNIKSVLYYINTVRTYGQAREYYKPKRTFKGPVHFFKASYFSYMNEQLWQQYCSKKVHYYVVKGNHYSIFRQPQVEGFAEYFTKALYGRS